MNKINTLQAKILKKTAQQLHDEFKTVNSFNYSEDLAHIKHFHDQLNQRMNDLQKKQNDLLLQQTLANSESARKAKIDELKKKAI